MIPRALVQQLRASAPLNARRVLSPAKTFPMDGIKRHLTLRKYTIFAPFSTLTYLVSWLYTLFLMVDGNFRLKLKDRGFTDVALSAGWAYFVEERKYSQFTERYSHYSEVSTLSYRSDPFY